MIANPLVWKLLEIIDFRECFMRPHYRVSPPRAACPTTRHCAYACLLPRFGLITTDVPSHLHYIMLELIKNSMRATVDFHGLDEMDNNPIRVVIADGEENEVRLCLHSPRVYPSKS